MEGIRERVGDLRRKEGWWGGGGMRWEGLHEGDNTVSSFDGEEKGGVANIGG